MSGQSNPQTRLRIHFGKRGPLRYTSHLDLARIWERLLRRAQVKVVYSQGFNPRPKMHLAATLPLGCASTCEVLDVWLAGSAPPSLEDFQGRLQAVAPEGLDVQRVEVVDLGGPALQTLAREATYRITFSDGPSTAALREAVREVMAAGRITRERRGRSYDLRPLIVDLEVVGEDEAGEPALVATLSLGEAATGRPDELLAVLGLEGRQTHIERIAIKFGEPDAG